MYVTEQVVGVQDQSREHLCKKLEMKPSTQNTVARGASSRTGELQDFGTVRIRVVLPRPARWRVVGLRTVGQTPHRAA